ncbi:MAG: hypothetical protein ACREU7_15560, partial [Burkholderiales bacterium]
RQGAGQRGTVRSFPACFWWRVALVERRPRPEEVGRSMRELERGFVVRLYRDGQPVGFWKTERNRIQHGDLLLVIEPVTE